MQTKKEKASRKWNSKKTNHSSSTGSSAAGSIHNGSMVSIGNVFLAVIIVIAAVSYNARFSPDTNTDTSTRTSTSTNTGINTRGNAISSHDTTEQKIHNFLSWLKENGAIISEHVTMMEFPEYGGYGLFAKPMSKSTSSSSSTGHSHVLHALDEMFTIPANIITSTHSALEYFHSVQAQFPKTIRNLVQTHFHHSAMVQQDAIIATFLMQQCALGDKSRFKPYLDILPQEIIPRLDTFEQEHLTILDDPYLAQIAQESKKLLLDFYHDANFQFILKTMATTTMQNESTPTGTMSTDDGDNLASASCGSFESFHRFVSIVSSRAMVLYGQKYLTPFADLANYKPRSKERIDSGAMHTFTLFHEKRDGSIIVRADRDIVSGQQIFEDYGDLDNSLYLEAHGFVPDDNPFHCASIDGVRYLLDEMRQAGLVDVMIRLGMLPPSDGTTIRKYVPDVCIREDGSVDDLRTVKFLIIVALSTEPKKLQRCVDAQTRASAEMECLHYLGKTPSWKGLVRQLARRAYCDSSDSLEQDHILLQFSSSGERESIAPSSMQTILALKFRIADKRVLARVGDIIFEQCSELRDVPPRSGMPNTVLEKVSSNFPLTQDRKEEIQGAVVRFNAFIDSLDLPICNVRASYIDDDMRAGVVATKDIQEGEIYLSVPSSSSIISLETVIVEENSSLPNEVLNVLKSDRSDGGFNVLLFYLLHETYVTKNESKWYPYIQMLPSLDDLKRKSPLFFEEDMFDYLAGSDIRSILIENQQRARKSFQEFVNVHAFVKALGLEHVSFDKFLWAYAIIHSRSIWWNGMRHLVPMLDLVNCAELNNSRGDIAVAHETRLDGVNNAVTNASTRFERGDQIFENYSQPNHIYFLYHGFVLEDNSQDCLMFESFEDHPNNDSEDLKARKERLMKNGFRSFTPSFCIRDIRSLDSLANFRRINNRLPGDNLGLGMDTIYMIKEELLRRSRLFGDIGSRFEIDSDLSYPMHAMKTIVSGEKEILESLLNDIDDTIHDNTIEITERILE